MTETSSGLIDGTVIAAVVTGLVALHVFAGNHYQARRDRLRKDFAEALAAVERYAELPYRILRRQASTPDVRGHIAEQVHEVQQDILFHKSWVRIQSSEVADVYDSEATAKQSLWNYIGGISSSYPANHSVTIGPAAERDQRYDQPPRERRA